MNIKNLQERVSALEDKTKTKYIVESPKEREILAKTVKLNEEVGELCNDILGILKLQRKSKLDKFDKRNIYQEFADVIIVTMQLALTAGVDLERAINDKLKAIESRQGK
jgi:NTP pyrophosphatase (non-canonical NTP hydrolase)